MPDTHDGSSHPAIDAQDHFQEFVEGSPAPGTARPELPVQTRVQDLPLRELSWQEFERLCCRLVQREPGLIGTPHLYGIPGQDQKGIDIVAHFATDAEPERRSYQCKNVEGMSAGQLTAVLADMLKYDARWRIVLVAFDAGRELYDVVTGTGNSELWDRRTISDKLKGHPDLVADFFGQPWVDAFSGVGLGEPAAPPVNVRGTVYDRRTGHQLPGVHVVATTGTATAEGDTDAMGRFGLWLPPGEQVRVYAVKETPEGPLAHLSRYDWMDATSRDLTLQLGPKWDLRGRLRWCGSEEPITGAALEVNLIGPHQARVDTDENGDFRLALPGGERLSVRIQAPGVAPAELPVTQQNDARLDLALARECSGCSDEIEILQRVCGDLVIPFVRIAASEFLYGPPDQTRPLTLDEFFIGRFPVTCMEYSFYLQLTPGARLPVGWTSRFPRAGDERRPITGLDLREAEAFCEWLTERTGIAHRLPSAQEWQKAARGDRDARKFPWGDESDLDRCNSAEAGFHLSTVDNYPKGRSPSGVWDLCGNAWEWTSSPHEADEVRRIACGGSTMDPLDLIGCAFQTTYHVTDRRSELGFRVVQIRSA